MTIGAVLLAYASTIAILKNVREMTPETKVVNNYPAPYTTYPIPANDPLKVTWTNGTAVSGPGPIPMFNNDTSTVMPVADGLTYDQK